MDSNDRVAAAATLHCLMGCAVGEVAGMVIGTAYGLPALATVALSIVLAFASGYAFTMAPLMRSGSTFAAASRLALAADTVSILVMEVVDNGVMLVLPGAMAAPLTSGLFWASLVFSLAIAGVAAYPVNRMLIARGKGHALHGHHLHRD